LHLSDVAGTQGRGHVPPDAGQDNILGEMSAF
jgi:hypothetical protein